MDKHLRPCIAELVGTFFLCFIGAGTICTNEAAGGGSGLLGVAIAHGLALAIAVTATMNVSGGHLNPAVTITMWAFKRIDTDKALFYLVFQLLGGVIAGGLIVFIFGTSGPVTKAGYGTPHVNFDLLANSLATPLPTAIILEAILTFLLVFAIFGTAVDPRAPKVGGFGIGLTIAFDILLGGPLTGASMNPARTFGPGIWEAGILGFDRMRDHFVYWIGPIAGGILAGLVYTYYVLPPEHHTTDKRG
jgi:MIP family channel proteins